MSTARSGPPWRKAAARAVVPLVAAGVLWWLDRTTGAVVAAATGALLLVIGLAAPWATEELDRLLARLADRIAHVAAAVLAAAVWAVFVLPIWALSRATRYDPLDAGWTTTRTAWTDFAAHRTRAPDHHPTNPDRPGGTDLAPDPRTRRRAMLRWAPVAIAAVALIAWAAPRAWNRLTAAGAGTGTASGPLPAPVDSTPKDIPDDELLVNGYPVDDYAHEDEPWAKDFFRELLAVDSVPDLVLGARNGDFRGRYLNVVDGRRATWTPNDPQLTVWFFGGSTTYGIGQRDDHTIPSVFAKAAAADGIRVRALNFGVSGDVNWVETLRFAEALQDPDLPRPDLVVFYDGVNDRGLASMRVDNGNTDPAVSDRLALSDPERASQKAAGGGATPMPYGPQRNQVEATLAAEQYRRGAATARDLAGQAGIPVIHVWQPQPFAFRPGPEDQELYRRLDYDTQDLPDATRTYAQIRERSGVAPVDLSGVLDDVDRPVFFDSSHTNELGARIVGRELYRNLRPQLEELRPR